MHKNNFKIVPLEKMAHSKVAGEKLLSLINNNKNNTNTLPQVSGFDLRREAKCVKKKVVITSFKSFFFPLFNLF